MTDLNKLQKRLDILNDKLTSNSINPVSEEYVQLTREISKISGLIMLIDDLQKLENEKKQAKDLLQDDDFKEVAKNEIESLDNEITSVKKNIEKLSSISLPNDDKKAPISAKIAHPPIHITPSLKLSNLTAMG